METKQKLTPEEKKELKEEKRRRKLAKQFEEAKEGEEKLKERMFAREEQKVINREKELSEQTAPEVVETSAISDGRTVLILGATGLLGNAVYKEFLKNNFNVIVTFRDSEAVNKLEPRPEQFIQFDPFNGKDLTSLFNNKNIKINYVINCIGKIKPFVNVDKVQTIFINSLFPHLLSRECKARGIKLFSIATDCSYSHKEGSRTEKHPHNCEDFYGRTKSLGEPEDCMNLRVSIIGEEIHKNASLLEWVRRHEPASKILGFQDHIWNGITTKTLAQCIIKIIQNGWYSEGVYHVFSPSAVSKAELIDMINDKYDLKLKLNLVKGPYPVDRTLSTIHDLNSKLEIPEIKEQIENL